MYHYIAMTGKLAYRSAIIFGTANE